jgi:hypothetical protein
MTSGFAFSFTEDITDTHLQSILASLNQLFNDALAEERVVVADIPPGEYSFDYDNSSEGGYEMVNWPGRPNPAPRELYKAIRIHVKNSWRIGYDSSAVRHQKSDTQNYHPFRSSQLPWTFLKARGGAPPFTWPELDLIIAAFTREGFKVLRSKAKVPNPPAALENHTSGLFTPRRGRAPPVEATVIVPATSLPARAVQAFTNAPLLAREIALRHAGIALEIQRLYDVRDRLIDQVHQKKSKPRRGSKYTPCPAVDGIYRKVLFMKRKGISSSSTFPASFLDNGERAMEEELAARQFMDEKYDAMDVYRNLPTTTFADDEWQLDVGFELSDRELALFDRFLDQYRRLFVLFVRGVQKDVINKEYKRMSRMFGWTAETARTTSELGKQ